MTLFDILLPTWQFGLNFALFQNIKIYKGNSEGILSTLQHCRIRIIFWRYLCESWACVLSNNVLGSRMPSYFPVTGHAYGTERVHGSRPLVCTCKWYLPRLRLCFSGYPLRSDDTRGLYYTINSTQTVPLREPPHASNCLLFKHGTIIRCI